MSMNPEIKAQWTAALRSGEYQQATGYLRTPDGYCCLGVLCELGVKAGVIPAPKLFLRYYGDNYAYGDEKDELSLPEEIKVWAGLDNANPSVDPDSLPGKVLWDSTPSDNDAIPSLANANDGRTSFAVIADIIDQQL